MDFDSATLEAVVNIGLAIAGVLSPFAARYLARLVRLQVEPMLDGLKKELVRRDAIISARVDSLESSVQGILARVSDFGDETEKHERKH